jgi:ELWxxDGT repeat protein
MSAVAMTLVAAAAVVGPTPGPARLVKDINSSPTPEAGSFPDEFVTLGDVTIFTATSPEAGLELWRTDGTGTGTFLLKDIRPGAESSQPRGLKALDGAVFFQSDDGVHGLELWRTDGTAERTALVADIRPGLDGALSYNAALVTFRGSVFFGANDGVHGFELWKSDGTEAGTALVKNVNPSSNTYGGERALAKVGDALLFVASDGIHGFELWRTDGTADGTALVKDIHPGPYQSLPGGGAAWHFSPVELGGVLYFQALDDTHGLEVWRSDGTEQGTFLLKDIDPSVSLNLLELAEAGGMLFLSADDGVHGQELWRSDGTEVGTVLVRDIYAGPFSRYGSYPASFTEFHGELYFQAGDAEHGGELWRSDGTEAGTILLKDITPGPGSSVYPSYSSRLVEAGGRLFFVANDGLHGSELWKTDGTEAGTVLVEDIRPGPASSFANFGFGTESRAGSIHGMLLFGADDGTHGQELWRSDGTAQGTSLVEEINPFFQTAGAGANPLGVIDGILFFATYDGVHGSELWRTDGTKAGTTLVKDIYPGPQGSDPGSAVVVGRTLFFAAHEPAHGLELWRSDGTAEGTVLVRDIAGFEEDFPLSSSPRSLVAQDGIVFFHANDRIHGNEPWRSDGTEAGTFLLQDISPGSGSSSPGRFTALAAAVIFPATDQAHGQELWRSDGTPDGTVLLADVNPGPATSLGESNYAEIDGVLFFPATDGIHGVELWRTDGTEAGTTMVKDVHPGTSQRLLFRARAVVGRTLFFVANEFSPDAALWKSDGTDAGTVMVKGGINPTGKFFYIRLISVGDNLLFNADDGVHGVELWKSDGTEEGTVLVEDVHPGAGDGIASSSSPPFLLAGDGILYLLADDGSHGQELWRSDGTAAGTFLVRDIRPGIESSAPVPYTTLTGALLFRADDGIHGVEPWSTNGTHAALIQDIAPGPAESHPSFILDGTIAGTRVPFLADDGHTGWELWAGRAAILTGQPRRAVEDLRAELRRARLPVAVENVLGRALDAASSALAEPGGGLDAIDALERFARKVAVLSPALIGDEDRGSLLEFAQDIVTLIGRPRSIG